MSSIFAMAMEGASVVGFGFTTESAEMAKLDSETEAAMEAYITEDPVSFTEYVGECFEELKDSHTKEQAAEGYFAVKYMQAVDESSKAAVMESLSDKLGDAWDAIKRFIAKVWEAIKKYAKKAWDFLKKRYELAKGMIGKYESVLRNKKVDPSIKFDWAQVNIKNLMTTRQAAVAAAAAPFKKGISGVTSNIKTLAKDMNKKNVDVSSVVNDVQNITVEFNKSIFSTAALAETLDSAIWGKGNKGPKYDKKTWGEISSDAMHFATTDPSKTVSEALGMYEKDTKSLNSVVNSLANEVGSAIKDKMEGGSLERLGSMARTLCRTYAAGISKVNSMAMSRLTAGAKTLQSQAIAACRRAITAKGTTSESFDFDSIIM